MVSCVEGRESELLHARRWDNWGQGCMQDTHACAHVQTRTHTQGEKYTNELARNKRKLHMHAHTHSATEAQASTRHDLLQPKAQASHKPDGGQVAQAQAEDERQAQTSRPQLMPASCNLIPRSNLAATYLGAPNRRSCLGAS